MCEESSGVLNNLHLRLSFFVDVENEKTSRNVLSFLSTHSSGAGVGGQEDNGNILPPPSFNKKNYKNESSLSRNDIKPVK